MKKLTFLLSVLLISAFALAACAGGEADDNATPGALTTPATGVETAVPVVTEAATEAATVAPTATMVAETPVAEATATVATGAVTGTPQAGAPVAGDDDCNPNSVQGLLDMDVVDAQGTKIGDVNSLIVLRDTTALGAQSGDANAAGTPAATVAATAAATPATDGAGNFVAGTAPQIAYVNIDLENEDNDLIVPLTALDMTVRDRDVQGVDQTPAAGATAVTPAAGAQDPVGDVANEFDTCYVTLKNVKADALSALPRFDREADFSVDTWDEKYRAYWTGQGLQIPATGANNLGAPAVIDDEFNNIDARNPNNDDLGEVEDFIFNPQTGEVNYAILAAGGFLGLGETKVPVPMSRVQWLDDDPGDKDDAGYVVINIKDAEIWKNAPEWDNKINTTIQGWDEKIQAYWNSITD